MTKRIISMLLILTLLIGTVPTAAFAETPTTGDQSSVDTGELTLEGTNSFGTLLTEDITEQQEQLEEAAQSGYTVTDLVIEDDTAIVTYDTLEEATLVVALYTEDGMQLLTSGTTTVQPEETTAYITIEGEMPQYFMASAYLLDTYDFSPLCTAYDTPMYTKEMQDLLASTVEDYDADRVLNLDDSNEINFAVYAEDTIVIEETEGVNTVTSVDDTTSTYVISNADNNITSLQTGDVFVYPYEEDQLLIVKVDTITLNGTTATITGAELEMEEAFSHVKIDGTNSTEEMTIDDTTAAQGITYEGLTEEETVSPIATFAMEGGDSKTFSHEFKLDLSDKYSSDNFDASYSIKGSLKLQATVSVKYYVTLTRQYLEFKNVQSVKAGIYLNGTINVKLPLGSIGMSPVPGVYVGFDPKIVLVFTGEVDVSLTLSSTVGIKFDRNSGVKNISTNPDVEFDFNVEGTLYFGIDFDPNVKIVDEHIAKLGMTAQVGVELKAKATGSSFEVYDAGSDEIHTCEKCIDIDLTFKAELSGNIKFLGLECLTVKITIGSWSVPLGNAYYSVDQNEFGFGSCPNRSYRVSILVEDLNDQPYADAEVSLASSEVLGKTNNNGVVVAHLPYGQCDISATFEDRLIVRRNVFISDACLIIIRPNKPSDKDSESGDMNGLGDNLLSLLDSLHPTDFQDHGAVIASGQCGEIDNTVFWKLYDSGTLYIYGSGAMKNYGFVTSEWRNFMSKLNRAFIMEGVTTIGACAFSLCSLLESVSIPKSVSSIGRYAFDDCTSLTSVTIPESVTSISDSAFYNCTNLTTVTIPEGVTSIGRSAFERCSSLTSVTIPQSVTSICDYAFSRCTSLTGVTIQEGVTSIDDYTFCNCSSLTEIVFCGDAPSIGSSSFCNVKATAYYPADNTTWTSDMMQNYGGTLTWVPYTPEVITTEAETLDSAQKLILEDEVKVEMDRLDAMYGGEYGNEVSDTYTNIKTATFTGLVPGEDYVLLALASLEIDAPLGTDNLLFIDQGTAAEDGTLEFKYVQRVDTALSYVMACGASNKDLADAVITFPDMVPNGETQVVDPEVVYDGETLEEGRDYVVLGDVDFTEAGTYTCYIRGIYQYAGLVECTYHVMVVPTLELSYPTLSFEDEIFYNVYYTVSDTTSVVEMGLMVLPSRDDSATIEDAISVVPGYITNGTVFLAKSEGVAAANMGDALYFKVYAKLTDGSYAYSTAGGYNAKAYANSILSSNNSDEMKSLVVSMLNYGAQAQLYFGHNTDKLVNNALTTEQQTLVAAYDSSMMDAIVKADTAKTAEFVRVSSNFKQLYPSVSFDSAFAINFYCQSAITVDSGMTLYYWDMATMEAVDKLSLDNATGSMEMVATGDVYWGQVPGIAAKDMDKTYYVTCVFESESETITTGIIPYTLGKYCTTKADTDGDALQAFAQATAVYGYYAKQYFASIA